MSNLENQQNNMLLDRKIYINFVYLYRIFKLPIPYHYDDSIKKEQLNEKMEDLIMLNEIQIYLPHNYFINKLLIECLFDLYKFIELNNKLNKNKTPVYKKFRCDILNIDYPKHKFLYYFILIMFILNILLYIYYLNYEE